MPAFVVEARLREGDPSGPPRFGFTVTKKIGSAVVRNRIRRRLKALVRSLMERATPGHDYVLIAREPAHNRAFKELAKDLEHAFERVHDRRASRSAGSEPAPPSSIEKSR